MSEKLTVVQLGNPILRRHAQPIEKIRDEAVQQLINDLIALAQTTNAVGIAAPQVGESQRLLVIASRPNLRYPHAPHMAPTAMINPIIINHSDETVKDWEGCLSIPGIRGLVPRYQEIEVEYTCPEGKIQRQVLTDFVARIFQHEYDHLEGKVFLDRLEEMTELMTEDEYQRQIIAEM
jgi:peptide deformylase